MYAIRSYYEGGVLRRAGADVEIEIIGHRPAVEPPGRPDRRGPVEARSNARGRITSYNVCYTKLLRFRIWDSPEINQFRRFNHNGWLRGQVLIPV